MPLKHTLDEKIVDDILELHRTIKQKKYWNPYDYQPILKNIEVLLYRVQRNYTQVTMSTLRDSARRIFENKQSGGFETFVNFFNAYLFLRKLQYLIEYHQDCGKFPD